GKITLTFTNGSADVAFVNAVEVLQPNQVVATTTTDADGNYLFNQPTPGQYTIREVPPVDWRQVAPFYSDPSFASSPLPADSYGFPLSRPASKGEGYAIPAVMWGPTRKLNFYYNKWTGPSAPADSYSLPAGQAIKEAVPADLNNDGWMDLVVLLT